MIPPEFDVRQLLQERVDKRGRLLRPFETVADMKKERDHRIRLLRSFSPKSSLADTLENCTGRDSCGSLACPLCSRRRRYQSSAAILEFLAGHPLKDLRYLTLINPADALPAGHLDELDPKKLVNRLRRQLERAGLDKTEAFLIGALDGEWDEGWEVFQPHIHAVTYHLPKTVLSTLLTKWPRTPRVKNWKRRDPIDDLPRVVAYLDKAFWPCVARKDNPRGIYPHGKRRPPASIEIEILSWLNSYLPEHLHLRLGVKSYGHLLIKT